MKSEEEFNLKEKRNTLNIACIIAKPDEYELIKVILELIDKQDKEFIKRLKDSLCFMNKRYGCNNCLVCNDIDKLSGFEE